MNITNNYQSPNFGLSINVSKMSHQQEAIANSIARKIEGSLSYSPLRNLELILLPGNKASSVTVKVLDFLSGNFLKNKNNRHLQMSFSNDSFETADKVIDFYNKSSNLERPKINLDNIVAGRTFLQKNFCESKKCEMPFCALGFSDF